MLKLIHIQREVEMSFFDVQNHYAAHRAHSGLCLHSNPAQNGYGYRRRFLPSPSFPKSFLPFRQLEGQRARELAVQRHTSC